MAPPTAAELPEGWTVHELNGSRFYYHRASNTVQSEAPASPAAVIDATPPAAAASPAAPPAETAPCSQPELHECVAADAQAPEVPPQPAPTPTPTPPPEAPAPASPAPQEQGLRGHFQAPPAADAQPAPVLASAPPFQTPPMTPRPSQGQQPTIVSVTPPPQNTRPVTWHKLNVLVPEPGLRAFQELAFETPAGNGLQSQKLKVEVQEPVAAGSMITVRYPGLPVPVNSVQVPTTPSPSMPSVDATLEEDRQATLKAWGLYAMGWLFIFCFAPFGLCLWIAAASMYFCKPKSVRARRQRQRKPAYTSLFTILGMLMAWCVIAIVVLCNQEGDFHGHHVHHHHHHHHKHHHDGAGFKLKKMLGWHHHGHHHHHDNEEVEETERVGLQMFDRKHAMEPKTVDMPITKEMAGADSHPLIIA